MSAQKWRQAQAAVEAVGNAHGFIFYDRDTGDVLDAGQAVCRQIWGPNWMHDQGFQDAEAADEPPQEFMAAAAKMVEKLPAWCVARAAA